MYIGLVGDEWVQAKRETRALLQLLFVKSEIEKPSDPTRRTRYIGISLQTLSWYTDYSGVKSGLRS